MKLFNLALMTGVLALSFSSCKKFCYPKPEPPTCTETGSWIGYYGSDYGDQLIVADSTFIGNGIARLQNSPWSYFYTSIHLPIPECRIMDADTLTLEVSLKNSPKDDMSIADHDVSLWMYGTTDTARVIYIGYRPQFTSFGLNNQLITNSTNLLNVFYDWTTVTLEANNFALTTKKADAVAETFTYSGQIGTLKKIAIGFKAAGSVDWVKIYSSKSKKLLMKEDFDTDGASSVTWY